MCEMMGLVLGITGHLAGSARALVQGTRDRGFQRGQTRCAGQAMIRAIYESVWDYAGTKSQSLHQDVEETFRHPRGIES